MKTPPSSEQLAIANAIVGKYFWDTETPPVWMVEQERGLLRDAIAAAIAAAAQAARAQALEVAARQVEITDEGFLGLIDSQKAADAIRALAAQPEGGEA